MNSHLFLDMMEGYDLFQFPFLLGNGAFNTVFFLRSDYCKHSYLLLCLAGTLRSVGLSTVAKGSPCHHRCVFFSGNGVHLWLLTVCVHSYCGKLSGIWRIYHSFFVEYILARNCHFLGKMNSSSS